MKIMEVSILLAFELIFVDGELGLESNFCSLVARQHFIGRLMFCIQLLDQLAVWKI